VRAAAAALRGTEISLGILPLGTLNRLARDLEIPLDPAHALTELSEGRCVSIDVGEVNQQIFVCQVLLGLPVALAARRQRLRGSDLLKRAGDTAGLLFTALRWSKRLRITAATPREGVALKVLAAGITVDEFSENPSLLLKREVLDRGYLTLYASKHRSGADTLRAVVRAMLGRIKDDPDIRILRGDDIELNQPGKSLIACSLDGEIHRMSLPLKFRVRKRELRVLRPRR